MQKIKTGFTKAILAGLSLILAAVFAAAMLPFSAFTAHADEIPGGDNGGGDEPEVVYDGLYYFSDYYGAEDYCTGLLADIIYEYNVSYPDSPELELNYKPLQNIGISMQNMGTLEALEYYEMADDGFPSISNAVVIIEIRNLLDYNTGDYNKQIFLKLEDIFKELKKANCKTAFICGTDEFLFEPITDFLQFVDVHINTDLYYGFMKNVLNVLERDYDGIQGRTIILDGIFASKWFYQLYFIKCLASKYEEEFNNIYIQNNNANYSVCPLYEYIEDYLKVDKEYKYLDYNRVYSALKSEGFITVLIHEGKNIFIDAATGTYLSDGEYNEIFGNVETRFCILASTNWYDKSYDLEDYILYLQENYINEIPTFVYNTSNYISSFSFKCKQGGISKYWLDYYIKEIIRELVFGGDLQQYHNYKGDCEVTFKPVFAGEGGWMEMDLEDCDLMKIVED